MSELIVGIDLGTTNSLCAVFENGQPRLIPNAHGSMLTPSVVGIMPDGQVLVGSPAKEFRVTHPDRCTYAFKRFMGTDRQIQIADQKFNAPELSSLVLRSLKEDAEAALGEPVEQAVITVPAYFNDAQRKATKKAGEMAGLRVKRIINEPTAAALTYGFHERDADKKIIVIDLGGGTFDVTLMEIFEGTLEIISTAGESFLGGEDFTDRLVATVLKTIGLQLEQAEMKSPLLVSRLRQECDVAKRAFANADAVSVRVPNESGELDERSQKVKVTREAYAKVSQRLMERLKSPIGKALRDGSCHPDEVDDVILVGGATRMPILQDFIKDYFGREPLCRHNPDEVVALGSAIQAALILDDAAVEDMVLTDVCPYTLGVEVVKQFGNRMAEGYYTPVIHRNTTIPVSKEESFSTVMPNQSEVSISVYQGESRRVKDNFKLGDLKVSGIPPGPAGTEVCVRFTYDMSGILEVEAFVPASGKKFRSIFTQHAQDLTESEIQEAVDRMQSLKFYPRDQVENQRLVLLVERVIGEVSPMQRTDIEQALDMFEQAMAAGNREVFETAKQGLLMMLSSLGVNGLEFDESGETEI